MSEEALQAARKASFGIETLLKPDARVVYENIFSTRHIGRVVDFFLHECRAFLDASPDPALAEYRVRSLLEMAVFTGWTNYRKDESARCVELEAGWDDERMVLAAAFYAEKGVASFVPGSGEPKDETSRRLQNMLGRIQQSGDGVMVRHDAETERVQVIAFFTGKPVSAPEAPGYVNVAEIETPESADAAMDAAAPSPLSSGRFEEFRESEREDDARHQKAASDAEGVTVVEGGPTETEGDVLVKGTGQQLEGETEVSGLDGEGEASARVRGRAKLGMPESFVVAGGSEEPGTGGVRVQTEEPGEGAEASQLSDPQTLPAFEETIEETAKTLVGTLKGQLTEVFQTLTKEELEEYLFNMEQTIRKHYVDAARHFLKMWTIRAVSKIRKYKETIRDLRAQIAELEAASAPAAKATSTTGGTAPDDAAIERDFNDFLTRFDEHVASGFIPSAATGWARGLMENAVRDRAVLNQRLRESEARLRKTDFDLRSVENVHREQLRMKDELLKHKEAALGKSKESLMNAIATLEKYRSVAGPPGLEKGQLEQRLVAAERVVVATKENNEHLNRRIDELKQRLSTEMNARAEAHHQASARQKIIEDLQRKLADLGATRARLVDAESAIHQRDIAVKTIDTLKKQIRELQEKLMQSAAAVKAAAATDTARKAEGASDIELRHKLEQSGKLVKAMKDEVERYRKRCEDLRNVETQLRIENARLTGLVKAAGRLK